MVAGFPKFYWHGLDDKMNVLVSELLGLSLDVLFNMCNRSFTLKTVLMVADQAVCYLKRTIELIFGHS